MMDHTGLWIIQYDDDLNNGDHHMEDMNDNYNNNNDDDNNIQQRQQQHHDDNNNSYNHDDDQQNGNGIDTNIPLGVHQRTANTTATNSNNKAMDKNVTNNIPP